MIRKFLLADKIEGLKNILNFFSQIIVLILIFVGVSVLFNRDISDFSFILLIIPVLFVIRILSYFVSYIERRILKITDKNFISSLFYSGQKSVQSGFALFSCKNCFPGANLGVLILVLYHSIQLILDSTLVFFLSKRHKSL